MEEKRDPPASLYFPENFELQNTIESHADMSPQKVLPDFFT